jgi:uncharacterized protein YjlB
MATPPTRTPHLHRFGDAGAIPNNPDLPVVHYRRAIELSKDAPAAAIEAVFAKNRWKPDWRDKIYNYHHYHSTAHEVMGVAAGYARVRLGGISGDDVELEPGDVVVLPAGTGHKLIAASEEFLVVGAYPKGQDWDVITAEEPQKKAEALATIARLPFPAADPVYGKQGPLIEIWVHKKSAVEAPPPSPARPAKEAPKAKLAKKPAKAAKPKQKPKVKAKPKKAKKPKKPAKKSGKR